MSKHKSKEEQYLIIGGTTKAATTSLFNYLADHPEVSASKLKETRFFLDKNYPVRPHNLNSWQDGIENFHTLFSSEQYTLRVEATPDYLYSTGTPQRIKELLPNSKIVFILRNPISRVISWYKYSQQIGVIPKDMTFDTYINTQLEGNYFEKAKTKSLVNEMQGINYIPLEYFLSALEHGRYTTYIQSYLDILGEDKVRVYFYENLCTQPREMLVDLCNFASLSANFYDEYDFQIFNRSVAIKNRKLNSIYSKLRRSIRRKTYNMPIHQTLRQIRLSFDHFYYRINSSTSKEVEISPVMQNKLSMYYKPDVRQLENLLHSSAPWSI